MCIMQASHDCETWDYARPSGRIIDGRPKVTSKVRVSVQQPLPTSKSAPERLEYAPPLLNETDQLRADRRSDYLRVVMKLALAVGILISILAGWAVLTLPPW